jgi:hypothetical protein
MPDPLDDLRERLRATQEAAERLAGEAEEAARARESGRVPPQGWSTPGQAGSTRDELEELGRLLATLRDLVPDELQAQLREVVRQVLLLVRALIDWWVDRIEAPRGAEREVEVEEIPVD